MPADSMLAYLSITSTYYLTSLALSVAGPSSNLQRSKL